MTDADKSVWLASDGRCVEGTSAGQRLAPVVATAWLSERWRGFFPGRPVWRATK